MKRAIELVIGGVLFLGIVFWLGYSSFSITNKVWFGVTVASFLIVVYVPMGIIGYRRSRKPIITELKAIVAPELIMSAFLDNLPPQADDNLPGA